MSERPHDRASLLDRALRVFSDVRAGEGALALVMTANVFVVMLGYYVLKTVREPLILASGGDGALPFPVSGSEGKAYAASAQALCLVLASMAYARLAARWSVRRLIHRVIAFFFVCLLLFYAAAHAGAPHLGFVFYVWVGVFNVAVIAQFWAFANDVYPRESGERIFPIVMLGMGVGGWLGSKLAATLYRHGVDSFEMMLVAAALLLLHAALYQVVHRLRSAALADAPRESLPDAAPFSMRGAFALLAESRYLKLIAALLIAANLVNTTGEYLLSVAVTEAADGAPDRRAFIGATYADFHADVNMAVLLVQGLLTSRIVRLGGIRAVVFALPLVALSAYSLIAVGATFAVVRWAKVAENTADYSLMGTAKALLFLPTTREEKYKAKVAIDTVFVRIGDVLASGLVALGLHVFALDTRGFALVNVGVIGLWLLLALGIARRYRALAATLPS
ncbi:MAG: Npt1/Npt2 family nucleotide transporter [Polyangiales bacterium]|nr:translocase [Myxococcales bacterium]MCB9656863.1 translocase [Sandaracinaceae bacterium]